MLNMVIDGNLAESPQPAKNQKYLRIKFCHNQREWTKDGIKESKIWVSGLVRPEKIQGIRDRLVKGAYVIASTGGSAASLSEFKGTMQVNMNFIGQFDIGKSPADKAQGQGGANAGQPTAHGAIGEPPQQQVAQPQPYQQPAPNYQQPVQQYQRPAPRQPVQQQPSSSGIFPNYNDDDTRLPY